MGCSLVWCDYGVNIELGTGLFNSTARLAMSARAHRRLQALRSGGAELHAHASLVAQLRRREDSGSGEIGSTVAVGGGATSCQACASASEPVIGAGSVVRAGPRSVFAQQPSAWCARLRSDCRDPRRRNQSAAHDNRR